MAKAGQKTFQKNVAPVQVGRVPAPFEEQRIRGIRTLERVYRARLALNDPYQAVALPAAEPSHARNRPSRCIERGGCGAIWPGLLPHGPGQVCDPISAHHGPLRVRADRPRWLPRWACWATYGRSRADACSAYAHRRGGSMDMPCSQAHRSSWRERVPCTCRRCRAMPPPDTAAGPLCRTSALPCALGASWVGVPGAFGGRNTPRGHEYEPTCARNGLHVSRVCPPVPACPVGAGEGGGILRLVTLEVFWATQDARLGTKLRLL